MVKKSESSTLINEARSSEACTSVVKVIPAVIENAQIVQELEAEFPDLTEVTFVLVTTGRKRWITKAIRMAFTEPVKELLKNFGSSLVEIDGGSDHLIVKLNPSADFQQDRVLKNVKATLNSYFYRKWSRKANMEYEGGDCWSEVSFFFETFDIPESALASFIRYTETKVDDEAALRRTSFEIPIKY